METRGHSRDVLKGLHRGKQVNATGLVLVNAETGKVRSSRSSGTDATTESLLSAPFR